MQGVEDEVPARDDQADDDESTTTMELVSYLVLNTGLDADYWERRVSIGYINEQMRTIVRQGLADDKPQKDDPRIIAERNLAYYIMQIEEKMKLIDLVMLMAYDAHCNYSDTFYHILTVYHHPLIHRLYIHSY